MIAPYLLGRRRSCDEPIAVVRLDQWRAAIAAAIGVPMTDASKQRLNPHEELLLVRGERIKHELEAAKAHRHWLSGTMPHDDLVRLIEQEMTLLTECLQDTDDRALKESTSA